MLLIRLGKTANKFIQIKLVWGDFFIQNKGVEKMFRIIQGLNNNAALVKDEFGKQAVVMGNGVTFQKKRGDLIIDEKIEHIYSLKDNDAKDNFLTLLKDIPLNFISATYDVIENVTSKYRYPVQNYIYVTLTHHVFLTYQAIINNKYQMTNLPDIFNEYEMEYEMAEESLKYLEKKLSVRFPKNEIGRIALHFINAKGENDELIPDEALLTNKLMNLIEQILKEHHIIRNEQNSDFYDRFMIHQSYLLERFKKKKTDSNPSISNLESYLKAEYKEAYKITQDICEVISNVLNLEVSKAEKTYIVLHIQRLI